MSQLSRGRKAKKRHAQDDVSAADMAAVTGIFLTEVVKYARDPYNYGRPPRTWVDNVMDWSFIILAIAAFLYRDQILAWGRQLLGG